MSLLGVWNWSETGLKLVWKPHLSLQLWPGGKGEPIIQERFRFFSSIHCFRTCLRIFWKILFQDWYQDGTSKKHLKTWGSTLDLNRCCMYTGASPTKTYIHTYILTYIFFTLGSTSFPLECTFSGFSRVQGKNMCNQEEKPRFIHAYIHTYIPTYLHTYIPTYVHTYIPTYLHTCIPTYLHTYIPAFQTCPFWGSETGLKLVWSPHLSLQLWPGEGRANRTGASPTKTYIHTYIHTYVHSYIPFPLGSTSFPLECTFSGFSCVQGENMCNQGELGDGWPERAKKMFFKQLWGW